MLDPKAKGSNITVQEPDPQPSIVSDTNMDNVFTSMRSIPDEMSSPTDGVHSNIQY